MIMLIYHITLIIMLIYSQHGICTRYGELSPASFTGKLMGGLCALCGIFFLTLPLPIVVNRFISIFCLFLFYILGPEPAFGRLGLDGLSGGYSSHGYTSQALLRAKGAQLGVERLCQNMFEIIYLEQGQWTII